MPRLTKSEMVGECSALYRKLTFIANGGELLFTSFHDVHDYDRVDEVRSTYEKYMAVKDDIEAMERCLWKQINKRINGAVSGLCEDYHISRPASIVFSINPVKNNMVHGFREW